MRTTSSLAALFFSAILSQTMHSQTSLSAFGLIPKNDSYIRCGSGMGANFFTKSLLPTPKIDTSIYRWKIKPPELRLGVQLYSANLHERTFQYTGTAGHPDMTVRNRNSGIDIVARISGAYSQKIIPYLDLMFGSRSFTGSQTSYSFNHETFKNTQTSVGTVAGLLMKMKGCLYFDWGVMLTHSRMKGQMYDVNTGRYEADEFVADKVNIPHNIIMVKAGLTIVFNGEGCGDGDGLGKSKGHGGSGRSYTSYPTYSNDTYYNNSGNNGSGNNESNNSNSNYSPTRSGSNSSNSSSSSSSSNGSGGSGGGSVGSHSNHSSSSSSTHTPNVEGTKSAPNTNSSSPAPQGNKTVVTPAKGGK